MIMLTESLQQVLRKKRKVKRIEIRLIILIRVVVKFSYVIVKKILKLTLLILFHLLYLTNQSIF